MHGRLFLYKTSHAIVNYIYPNKNMIVKFNQERPAG